MTYVFFLKSAEEHLDHLRNVLTALRETRLFIKMESAFGVNGKPIILVSLLEVAIFEYPNKRLQAIKNWPLPETHKKAKSFVALCSFYRTFIHHFADYSAPLTDLCRKSLTGRVVHSDTIRVSRLLSRP